MSADGGWSGVVLAGGASSRMGFDKAWIEVAGEPLVHRQLRLMAACGAGELLISGRAGADYGRSGVRILQDPAPERGPMAGIVAALEAASFPHVLVVAVDMPAVSPELLRFLLGQCSPGSGCVPRVEGRVEPLLAVYPAELRHEARRAMDSEDRSVQRWAERMAAQGRVRGVEVPEAWRSGFTNWNLPKDVPGPGRLGGGQALG